MSFSPFDHLNEKENKFVIHLYWIMHGHTYTCMHTCMDTLTSFTYHASSLSQPTCHDT